MKLRSNFPAVCFLSLVCALAAVPASADTLYDNSTAMSYTMTAVNIKGGFAVADSFTLSSSATISQIMFGSWVDYGDTLNSVDWAITTGDFSGTTLGSGTASSFSSEFFEGTIDGDYDMYSDVFSIPGQTLAAGTYYLQIGNAVTTGNALWDFSNGPSSAQLDLNGNYIGFDIGSETFALYGSSSPVPEPSSFLLLGSGLAGLVGVIKRKLMA
jgi:hypothetical protein